MADRFSESIALILSVESQNLSFEEYAFDEINNKAVKGFGLLAGAAKPSETRVVH